MESLEIEDGLVGHEIQLCQPNSPFPNIWLYRYSILEANEANKLWQQLIIQLITLPCGSLIIIMSKKDGTWRMCRYYIELNKITLKNHYSLPRIDDLLDML
jgi:hypothetical protein